ncbi:hypothetical protein BDV93DRAFT_547302 [Ceratobasidium sp. AG-I]|nr:hypothetical protein BDV93DRAFT_547302 [Ceratobasidium sp. AG-I]
MESKRIAPELILLILEYITCPLVQAKLCLLDTRTHALVAPILYNVCGLLKLEHVSAFCKAIKGNISLGRHVRGLNIHCPPPQPQWSRDPISGEILLERSANERAWAESRWTKDHVSDLRDALGLLPNLDTLIMIEGKGLENGRGLAKVFDGLEVTFQLKTLATMHFPGTAFMQFLKGQHSIEILRIQTIWYTELAKTDSDPESDGDGDDYNYYDPSRVTDSVIEAAADPAFLPNLSSLASEPLKCTALAPGRPIARVVITQNIAAPALGNDRFVKLAIALGKTSVPLESLEFISRFAKPKEMDCWDFFGLICRTKIPERLRALVLHDTEGYFTSHATEYPFLQRKAQLLRGRFKALERFEVPIRNDALGIITNRRLNSYFLPLFETMSVLSAWQEACPTLKQVMLYGEEIV